MSEDTDDLAEISEDGGVAALGARAAHRLQAHAGHFHVVPSPPEIVMLRRRPTADRPVRACALSGQISSAGALCDVLSFVAHAGWRGELVVREDTSSRSIFFDQGFVVSAQSDFVPERLGEVLYRHGVLTREQVVACGEASADGKMRFGEAAVKLGLLTREKLFDLMSRQTEEIFYGMLLVAGGMFYFLEGFDDAELSSRHRLSPSALIRDGIRRMHEMKYFRARIPSELHIPVRAAGRGPPPDAGPIYAAIDGTRSVADICRVAGEGEFDVTRALFQLVAAGHVFVRPPPIDPKAAVDVYNRAVALILRELDAMDEGDTVREQLATFGTSKQRYARVFTGAGPADDGTFDAARIARNVASAKLPEHELSTFLYEYASYALFLARPHVRRSREARGETTEQTRLSRRVGAILEPIAPATVRKQPPQG
jgi:hypothetical protein